MESNNLTINDINNLIETLKSDETVATAIMTQTKDLAMQTVRVKLYNFLNERDLKSAYVIVLKDNVAEAEKLSEFVYRKVKEALVKEKSANAIEAPDLAINEKKEQPTPAAEKQAPGEHLQPTSEHAPLQATAGEKTQPEAGAADRTQAAAGYAPTTYTTQAPTAPESRPHLSSFMLTIPNRFAERKNAGELTEQEARIEFKNFFTNALRTEQINENTPCQYVKLNGSAAPSQAYPGKTILDVCCDLAIAITFNQMQKIDSILNSPTHKQPQAQNMNPAMGQQRMNPMMGAQGVGQVNPVNGMGQMGQTTVSNPTMDSTTSTINTSQIAASSINVVNPTTTHEIDHVNAGANLVNNVADVSRQDEFISNNLTGENFSSLDFSVNQATPTENYSGNVYTNIGNKDTYKSTLTEGLTTAIVNSGTGLDISSLSLDEQERLLNQHYENNDPNVTILTPEEATEIIMNLLNNGREEAVSKFGAVKGISNSKD